ncbi:MAG TPA: undecaprenyl-phosphate glucose phosphotransferase [Leucothrix sp.]|nr:undecaprenyl-phosphate glucose phosphotransferase [Leucothrix sp.]
MDDKHISSELIYRTVDILIILLTLFLGSLYTNFYNTEGYLIAGLSAVVIFGLVGRFTDIYTSWSGRPLRDEAVRVLIAWLLTFLSLIFIAFVTKTSEQFSRVVLIAWLVATPILLILARFLLRVIFAHLRRLGINNRTVVIVGMTQNGFHFARDLENKPEFGYNVVGFYEDRSERAYNEILNHYSLLGNFDDMILAARRGEWDQIYIALPVEARSRMLRLLDELSDSATPIRLLPDYFTTNLLHSKFIEIADNPVLCIYDSPFSADHAFIKRIEDLLLGSIILTLISPILLAIAAAVKLTSKGPVLFKQTRYGLKGEKILVWKFRSMTVCEDGDTVTQATRGDSRYTKIGEFLRKTSLDELPQFFNVLQGTMSIVGPRPHAVAHNEQYRTLIPGYMLRHMIKPGITGWAQINGWRGETNTIYKMRKRVEFDLEYMREWSLWLDLKIIFFTIFRAFTDKNAY